MGRIITPAGFGRTLENQRMSISAALTSCFGRDMIDQGY